MRRRHSWRHLLRQHDAMLFRRMSRLFSKASLHGVNRVCESDTCCRPSQLAWSLILVLATVGMCVHIWSEVAEYMLYPVSSSSQLELNSFVFPAVTFCNPENPIKTRVVKQSALGAANDKLQAYSGVWDDPKVLPLYRLEHFVNFTKMGTLPEDVIAYCRYNKQPCSFRNFSLSFDRAYGNCFTFSPKLRRLRRPDIESGLILILYNPAADTKLEQAQLVGKMGYKMRPTELAFDTESFLISFHSAGSIAHPLQNSYPVSTGRLTVASLSQRNTSLANTPNRPCQPSRQLEMFDSQLQRRKNYTETLYDCAMWRDTMNMFRACGCVPEGLVRLEDFPNASRIPYCHLLTRKDEIANQSELLNIVQPTLMLHQQNFSMQQLKRRFPATYRRYEAFRCFHRTHLEPDVTCSDVCKSQSYSAVLSSANWPHPSNADSDDFAKQMIEISLLLQEYLDSPEVRSSVNGSSLLQRSLELRGMKLSACHTKLTHGALDHPEQRSSSSTQAALRECQRVHDFVSRHFLLVKVYPQSLTVEYLSVERSFQMPQLLSRVGGSLGLWVGTSLITFFECFEMLSTLGSYFAAKSLHLWLYHRQRGTGEAAAGTAAGTTAGTAAGRAACTSCGHRNGGSIRSVRALLRAAAFSNSDDEDEVQQQRHETASQQLEESSSFSQDCSDQQASSDSCFVERFCHESHV